MARNAITGAILPSPILAAYRWISMEQEPRNGLERMAEQESKDNPSRFLASLKAMEADHAKLENASRLDEQAQLDEKDAGADKAIQVLTDWLNTRKI